MARELNYSARIPLWRIMGDPDALKFTVEKLVREFGYGMGKTPGDNFGTPMVHVNLYISSLYDEVDLD